MAKNLIYFVHLWEQNKQAAKEKSGETEKRRNKG